MTLKELINNDINTVFLNRSETAEEISLKLAEGYEILIMATAEEILSDTYNQNSSRRSVEAVYKRQVTVYAREADFIKGLPCSGDWIYYNGKRMLVIRCAPDVGMVSIELGSNES